MFVYSVGTFIKLKNLTGGYTNPCVADIKMGKVSYDHDATPKKKESEMSKWPPMLKIGFRFCGMRVNALLKLIKSLYMYSTS